MTEQELTQSFKKENEKFLKYKWNDPELMKNLSFLGWEYEDFMMKFFSLYSDGIFEGIERITNNLQDSINSEIAFHSENKSTLDILNKRMENLSIKYLDNRFKNYANSENFITAFFSLENYRILSWRFYHDFEENKKNSDPDLSFESIIWDEIKPLKQLFRILIENILLKNKIQKLKTENLPKSTSDNRLTTNQIIVLLDRLKFIQGIEHLTSTNQARLISKICGFNEKNINKALVRLGKKKSELSEQNLEDINIVNQILVELDLDSKN